VTPREIVQRLNAEVRKALAAPELQRRFAELSLSVTPSSPEELDAYGNIAIELGREIWPGPER